MKSPRLCGLFDPNSMSPQMPIKTVRIFLDESLSLRIRPITFQGHTLQGLGKIPFDNACDLLRGNIGDAPSEVRKAMGMRSEARLKPFLSQQNREKLSLSQVRDRVATLIQDIIVFQFFLSPNILQKCGVFLNDESVSGDLIRTQTIFHTDIQSFGAQSLAPSSSDRLQAQKRLIEIVGALDSADSWGVVLGALRSGGLESEFARKRIADIYGAYQRASRAIPRVGPGSSR